MREIHVFEWKGAPIVRNAYKCGTYIRIKCKKIDDIIFSIKKLKIRKNFKKRKNMVDFLKFYSDISAAPIVRNAYKCAPIRVYHNSRALPIKYMDFPDKGFTSTCLFV